MPALYDAKIVGPIGIFPCSGLLLLCGAFFFSSGLLLLCGAFFFSSGLLLLCGASFFSILLIQPYDRGDRRRIRHETPSELSQNLFFRLCMDFNVGTFVADIALYPELIRQPAHERTESNSLDYSVYAYLNASFHYFSNYNANLVF